jgi:competence protein ComEC
MGGRCAVAVLAAVWIGLLAGAGAGRTAAFLCLVGALPFMWLSLRAPPRVATVAVLLALAGAGAARGGLARAALEHGPASLAGSDDARWIAARVLEHPLRESGEPLAILALSRSSAPLPAGTRLRLRLPAGCGAEMGDDVEALVRLERPPGLRNPGGFSSRAIAATAGVAVQGRALAARVSPTRGLGGWARATTARWRRGLEDCYARSLSREARELVTPLVIGDRSALPPSLGAHLRAAGLTHLLALSGLHVVWLAGLARGGAAALHRGVRGRAIAGAGCALLYMGLAGPLPSLMRAVATELVSASARLVGRALDPIQALSASALALLIAWPGWAADLGFQLSCAATLGLVTIGPWLTARTGRLRAVAALFVPTVAAQITALPLLLDRFHALPWLSLATNLLAVPVCGLLLAAAWAGALLDALLPGAAARLFSACELLAAALRAIAGVSARLPGALLATGSEPGIVWLAAGGAMLLALGLPGARALEDALRRSSRARVAACLGGALATLLALALAITARPLAPPAGRWWMVALDVGQGDAIALGLPDGWWFVDAGPRTPHGDAGEAVVMPFLRWAGVRALAALAVTHDDGDHSGGAAAVLRGCRVARVIVPPALPGVPGPGAKLENAGPPPARAARGDTLRSVWPEIIAVWPPRGARLPSDNTASLALWIGRGGGAALLAADLDSLREDSLRVAGPIAALKVAHHGSGSSSGAAFLSRARPAIAVISAGRRNAFGHPDAGALTRLAASGTRILRTDRGGAVWLELAPDGVRTLDWTRGTLATRDTEARDPRAPGVALPAAVRHW